MNRNVSLLAFLALTVSACGEGGAPPLPEAMIRDSSGVRVVEYTIDVPLAELPLAPELQIAGTPALRIGVVEGDPVYQFTRPAGATRLSDGGIAVLEGTPPEVRVYNADGSFRNRVSRQGEGPGEISIATAFQALPGDTLVVWDGRFRRLSRFTSDGVFVEAVTVQDMAPLQGIRQVALLPDGGVLLFGSTQGPEEMANRGRVLEEWGAVPVTRDGVVQPLVATRPGIEQELQMDSGTGGGIIAIRIMGRWWWERGYAAPSGTGSWFVNRSTAEVVHIDPVGGVDRRFRILAPATPFTAEAIRIQEEAELAAAEEEGFREMLEGDLALREYPATVPPVERVFGDAAGRAWLGVLTLPRQGAAGSADAAIHRWIVFESDGALLGQVVLPERSRPLWADHEGILLLELDDMDVAYVAWYPWSDSPDPT